MKTGFATALALWGAIAWACSPEPDDPPAPVPAPPEASAPAERSVSSVIEQKRRELAQVPGRSGILAERRRYSTFDEELIIRDFFQDRRDGFYLDVGCAWPVFASNTYYLEKHLGWTGIGVDALADYASAWKEKRPRSKFFSYLVSDRSGSGEAFYKSTNPGLSSTNPVAATGKAFGEELGKEEIQVPSITLNELLDREGVEKIDMLSMDIEGHEPKALAGFDIERFSPELVVIEGGQGVVQAYFERHGYEVIERYIPFDTVNRYFRRVDAAP